MNAAKISHAIHPAISAIDHMLFIPSKCGDLSNITVCYYYYIKHSVNCRIGAVSAYAKKEFVLTVVEI